MDIINEVGGERIARLIVLSKPDDSATHFILNVNIYLRMFDQRIWQSWNNGRWEIAEHELLILKRVEISAITHSLDNDHD